MKKDSLQYFPLVIFLMGPTASGKTNLVIALKTEKFKKIEIISVDSALVYKGMDIGTAKPSPDELKFAPHKLVDIRDPANCYSVADFYSDAMYEIQKILKSGNIPVLVGGTMLYFKILLQGLFCLPKSDQKIRDCLQYEAQKIGWLGLYNKLKSIDPISANRVHRHDHNRIIRALEIFLIAGKTQTELKCNFYNKLQYRVLQFAIMPSNRGILNNRIRRRFYKMLEIGFEDEVRSLFNRIDLHNGIKSSISCVGYKQMWEYLSGEINYDQMIYKGICATQKLAKRQLTWLRRWPNLYWLDSDHMSSAICKMNTILSKELFDI